MKNSEIIKLFVISAQGTLLNMPSSAQIIRRFKTDGLLQHSGIKKTFLYVLAAAAFLFSCSKSKKTETNFSSNLATKAETKAQFNNTSFGVYKGVVAGSTGYIIFKINNGDGIVKGYLTYNNTSDTLTTTEVITAGQPIYAHFTGRFSSMDFYADANGAHSFVTNVTINGNTNELIFVVHENSDKQVLCYEGTLSGSNNATGIFNCARVGTNNGDTAFVLAKAVISTYTEIREFGQVINNSLNVAPVNDTLFTIQGVFSDINFNGTWSSVSRGSGTFTCKRTL